MYDDMSNFSFKSSTVWPISSTKVCLNSLPTATATLDIVKGKVARDLARSAIVPIMPVVKLKKAFPNCPTPLTRFFPIFLSLSPKVFVTSTISAYSSAALIKASVAPSTAAACSSIPCLTLCILLIASSVVWFNVFWSSDWLCEIFWLLCTIFWVDVFSPFVASIITLDAFWVEVLNWLKKLLFKKFKPVELICWNVWLIPWNDWLILSIDACVVKSVSFNSTILCVWPCIELLIAPIKPARADNALFIEVNKSACVCNSSVVCWLSDIYFSLKTQAIMINFNFSIVNLVNININFVNKVKYYLLFIFFFKKYFFFTII